MSLVEPSADLERTLRDRFGLERFRPGQREVIEEVLNGRDVLCVMPTGGGKSLCYQLPALLLDGLTLVVSPLIALMKDQVDVLVGRGIRATLAQQHARPRRAAHAIDRDRGGTVRPRLRRARAVPSAVGSSRRWRGSSRRCWPSTRPTASASGATTSGPITRGSARRGRPSGSRRASRLTATATDLVRRDIADQLDLQDPALFVTGLRPARTSATPSSRPAATTTSSPCSRGRSRRIPARRSSTRRAASAARRSGRSSARSSAATP